MQKQFMLNIYNKVEWVQGCEIFHKKKVLSRNPKIQIQKQNGARRSERKKRNFWEKIWVEG